MPAIVYLKNKTTTSFSHSISNYQRGIEQSKHTNLATRVKTVILVIQDGGYKQDKLAYEFVQGRYLDTKEELDKAREKLIGEQRKNARILHHYELYFK